MLSEIFRWSDPNVVFHLLFNLVFQKPFENSQQQGVQMVESEGRLGLPFSRYSIPSFSFSRQFFARAPLSEHLEQANIYQRKISLRLAILLVAMLASANSNNIINHSSRDGRRSTRNINSSSYNCSIKNSADRVESNHLRPLKYFSYGEM